MLEPTTDGNVLSNNEQPSSTYTSAETSPNPSMTASLSSNLIRSTSVANCEDLVKTEQTLSHPLADLVGPSVKVLSTSTSSNAIEKLLKMGELGSLNVNEFQSLPPNILFENKPILNLIENQVELSGPGSQSIQDLVKTTVKTLIENTVKSSIDEVLSQEFNKEKEKIVSGPSLMPSLFPATSSLLTSTVSSSSPNPDCSPFKLLVNEIPNTESGLVKSPSTNLTIQTSTLSPNGSTIHEAVAVFNSELTKTKDDKVIESLALLNHKEHEQADPILSASSKNSSISNSSSSSSVESAQSGIDKGSVETKVDSPSKSSMTVPASSQEFCMSLNLNLAAAAAANATAPIVVCDNTKVSTSPKEVQQQVQVPEHNRFTSNASTSSIHNDLKMILEENKALVSPTGANAESEPEKVEKKAENEKKIKSPKPQREKLQKQKKSQNNKNKHNKSKDQTKSDTSLKSNGNNDELLNLIKLMKIMSDNKGKPHLDGEDKPGRYRYTKEFLTQVKVERAEFIDNIYPDIFKAYCYCMNGKYWDPEKYFDIIQYSGEYERIAHQPNLHHQSTSTFKNFNNNKLNNNSQKLNNSANKKKPSNKTPKVFDKTKTDQQINDTNNNVDSNVNSNLVSPLVNLGLVSNEHDADKILLNLLKKNTQVKQPTQAENATPKSVNLMEMFAKKQPINNNILSELFHHHQTQSQVGKPVLALPSATNTPRHYPVILTAQELELTQMNKENKLFNALQKTPVSENKLNSLSPSSCSSHSCTSECASDTSNADLGNSSEAYKQLIKNLSNHPLCTPPSANKTSNFENVLLKLQQKTSEKDVSNNGSNVSSDGTNLIKKLLNMNTNAEQNVDEKKLKNKRNHHNHHRHHHQKNKPATDVNNKLVTSVQSTTTTTTTTTITKTQFPSINPHEKPFQNFQLENGQNIVSKLSPNLVQNGQVLNEQKMGSPIENLIQKLKQLPAKNASQIEASSDKQHFSSLLNKIMPVANVQKQQTKVENNSGDILKWFSGINLNSQAGNKANFSAKTLSEIELMSGHFP